MNTIKHWIGGAEYEGTPVKTLDVENPGTGEVVSQLLLASDDDLNHAVEVATEAQKEWAATSLAKRTAIMFKMRQLVLDHQDEMAKLIV
ncbi:MAG: aldehyde dehydrogenase family protein, partial [Actinomyces sp.]|nr:aldehyde dehydrogenase family protein [Actinomyces sp.]